MGHEVELKLLVAAEDIPPIGQLLCSLSCSADQPQRAILKNTYFDTPDAGLQRQKIALRIRQQNGQFVQTLKTKGTQVGGLYQRGEWEWPLAENALDIALLAEHLPPGLSTENLEPVFQTDFTRTTWLVNRDDSAIELAIDQGAVIAGKRRQSISELELELKSGEPKTLYGMALSLASQWPMHVCPASKAERGYQLAGLATRIPVAIPTLDFSLTSGENFVRQVTHAMDQWQRGGSEFRVSETLESLQQSLEGAVNLQIMLNLMPDMLAAENREALQASLTDEVQALQALVALCRVEKMLGDTPDTLTDRLCQLTRRQLTDYQRATRAGEISLGLGEQLYAMMMRGNE